MKDNLFCDSCLAIGNHSIMAKLEGRTLIIYGRHHGERHIKTIDLLDLMPDINSQDYADIVAQLLRKAGT